MKKNRLKFWLTVILVLIIDRITKELAGGIPAEGIALVPGVIGLRYAENAGAAFSMLSGHPRLLGVLSLALITGGIIPSCPIEVHIIFRKRGIARLLETFVRHRLMHHRV